MTTQLQRFSDMLGLHNFSDIARTGHDEMARLEAQAFDRYGEIDRLADFEWRLSGAKNNDADEAYHDYIEIKRARKMVEALDGNIIIDNRGAFFSCGNGKRLVAIGDESGVTDYEPFLAGNPRNGY